VRKVGYGHLAVPAGLDALVPPLVAQHVPRCTTVGYERLPRERGELAVLRAGGLADDREVVESCSARAARMSDGDD
jgi:hypothetical protein